MRDLRDRVYGSLIGGAIGDALGAPVENWHYLDIRARYGRVTDFLPQPARARDGAPGQVTDDTTLRHYLCMAIVRKGGRVSPADYAEVWLDTLNPERLFVTERIVLQKLQLGMSPWETGKGQLAADAAIMAIAPIGIINADDPRQAYQDGFVVAGIHQDGLERDAAAAIAAGVAAAFSAGATIDSVVAAMTVNASYEVARLIEAGAALGRGCPDVDEFATEFYRSHLDRSFPVPPGQDWEPDRSVAATSREVLPAVAGLLVACGADPNAALVEGASLGRDADTIASVLGCVVGALHGASSLRSDWIAQCEAANADFFSEAEGAGHDGFRGMAEQLLRALHAHRSTHHERLRRLDALLAEPSRPTGAR